MLMITASMVLARESTDPSAGKPFLGMITAVANAASVAVPRATRPTSS